MHTLHVGHVGLMGNVHYLEILDWILAWLGHDIRNDDLATALALKKAAAQQPPPAEPPEPPPPKPPPKRPPRRTRTRPKVDVGPLDAQP